MRRTLLTLAVAVAAAAVSLTVAPSPAQAAAGFSVSGGRLVDANGSTFVLRGASHPHAWYPSRTGAFADIKAAGANSVRVVLSGGRWTANTAADVADVIARCKANRLICVLENHDTTGYGEQSGATTLDAAADYWIGLRGVLAGQEPYVIVNIGNEPYGNNPVTPSWTTATSNAIAKLRAAGLRHTLLVDAPNWGQDWRFEMRDNAPAVFAADPDRNTVFSIHMYGVFDTAAEVTDYLGRFRTAGLPVVVGEFGFDHSDGNPDENTIMSYAQANGIGWLAWSWSGNGGGVEYLDMVTGFDPARPTAWGQRVIDGPNGLRATAREASVYGTGPGPSPTAPSPTVSPTPTPPPSGACGAAYRVVNQWQGGFQAEVTVTAGSAALAGWTVGWALPAGQGVASWWNATLTTAAGRVTARNVDHNGRLAAGARTTFGFIGSGPAAGTPALTCAAG
ncbi:MAG: GH5_8 / GH5 / CBM2 [uncultured Corynebacteriales bacterium]|uniref:Endoglucanase n=1 Tax=uncultured Mycobacteriales bacterium TaxID=581187 RepID=A0A6J4JNE2_9ACTN|nr:MAG: GH5_8 / GH5 / CBM2 [uncultured Corynebacteriales bacterium]